MYGTRDDVLSPGPYAHLRRARYQLAAAAGAGIVASSDDDERNDEDDEDVVLGRIAPSSTEKMEKISNKAIRLLRCLSNSRISSK